MDEKKPKVTMQAVADEAGVSVTTVSHVVNRTRNVDPALRDKILEVIRRLGYNKNLVYKQRKKTRNAHIGVILPSLREGDFFPGIISVIESYATEEGYTVFFGDSEHSEQKEKELVETFLHRGVQGIILASVFPNASELQTLPLFSQVPTVLIDRPWANSDLDFIGIDDFKSALDATNLLIDYRFNPIFYVRLTIPGTAIQQRELGYTTAMASRQREAKILCFDPSGKPGFYLQEALSPHPEEDPAFFCANPATLCELLTLMKSDGLEVPENTGFLTYDEDRWLPFLPYSISYLIQPHDEIALTAIKDLISKIEGQDPLSFSGKHITLPVTFVNNLRKPLEPKA